MRSFPLICLFLLLGIAIAAEDTEYYCPYVCADCEEEPCLETSGPVCAKYQFECVYPCFSVEQTFPNVCAACQDGYVISYRYGSCEQEECEENDGDCYKEGCTECQEVEEECEECEEEEEEEEEEGPGCEEEDCEEPGDEEEEVNCNKVPPKVKVVCYSQDYNPVCGHFFDCPDGVCSKTFKNGCVACYYDHADWYIAGVCPVG